MHVKFWTACSILIAQVAVAAPDSAVNTQTDTKSVAAGNSGAEQNRYLLNAQDYADVRGDYRLSDGSTLRVWREHNRVFAQMHEKTLELSAVAKNTYVARRDRPTKLIFHPSAFDTEVTITELEQ